MVTLFPNVLDTLSSLKAQGVRLAVLTNRPLPSLETLVDFVNVRDYFEVCLFLKPTPQVISPQDALHTYTK